MPADTSHATSTQPTIGLALGGGGARGLAHIHVIEVLDEMGIRPSLIVGSSIGAIMVAAMAAGLSGRDIRDHTLATVGNRTEVMNRIWSLRPATIVDAWSNGFRFGQFNLERILRAFLPEELPARFEDLKIPLQVVAADFYGQSGRLDRRFNLAAPLIEPGVVAKVDQLKTIVLIRAGEIKTAAGAELASNGFPLCLSDGRLVGLGDSHSRRLAAQCAINREAGYDGILAQTDPHSHSSRDGPRI